MLPLKSLGRWLLEVSNGASLGALLECGDAEIGE